MELLKIKQNKLLERKQELKSMMDECNNKQPTFSTEDSQYERSKKDLESRTLSQEYRLYVEEEKRVDAQLNLIDELLDELDGNR